MLSRCTADGVADWMLVDTALHAYSMVSVPLYDTLGHEAVRYILGHAELQAIACSLAVLPTLLQCLPDCPNVKLVVSLHQSQILPLPLQGSLKRRFILRHYRNVHSLNGGHTRPSCKVRTSIWKAALTS